MQKQDTEDTNILVEMRFVKLIPVVLYSAEASVQMEGNARAPIKVGNAQSDDLNHRSSAISLLKKHLSKTKEKS